MYLSVSLPTLDLGRETIYFFIFYSCFIGQHNALQTFDEQMQDADFTSMLHHIHSAVWIIFKDLFFLFVCLFLFFTVLFNTISREAWLQNSCQTSS